MKGSASPSRSIASGSHARTLCRKPSRSSGVFDSTMKLSLRGREERDLLALLSWVTVRLPMRNNSAEVEMKVVVPGHTNPTVQLDAVLNQLGTTDRKSTRLNSSHLG